MVLWCEFFALLSVAMAKYIVNVKVYSLSPWFEIWKISLTTRIATHSSPCIGMSMAALLLHIQYGCGVLFICGKVFQNLEPDKRIDSSLSFFCI